MDVRAADTSTFAVKRLEMDGVQRIEDKRGFNQEGGYVDKVKARKEHRKGHEHGYPGGDTYEAVEETEVEDGLESPAPNIVPGEEHILDVKV